MEEGSVLLHHNPSCLSQRSNFQLSHFPVTHLHRDLMAHLDRLKIFLATAPSRWLATNTIVNSHQHPALNRFLLPSGEYVTCVLWSGLYHITGTDIVRALVFRFEAFGRPVRNIKKFEEGIFSDLRNLKPGHDACLEEPKSPFLDLLFKYQCIRTQKKQKVFYWFSVPHDRLFLDALERDLKRERMGLESTTAVVAEPALSFSYDPKRPLYEQFAVATKSNPNPVESDPEGTSPAGRQAHSEPTAHASASSVSLPELGYASNRSSMESPKSSLDSASIHTEPPTPSNDAPPNPLARSPFFNMFALFEGSPTYKQRRKKPNKGLRCSGDEDRDSSRHSLDIGSQSLDTSKHLLEGPSPMRSQPRNHSAGPAGPCQFRFMSGTPKISPTAPGSRLGQQAQAAPSLPAPTSDHRCPLYTCRGAFANTELLEDHIRAHEDDRQRADKHQGDTGMEIEDANAYPNVQVVRGTQQLQYPHGSPEIPQFTHVLTSPDGCSTYDGEDDSVYTAPDRWTNQSAESSAYSTVSASVPNSGHIQAYAYDTSSAEADSRSSSEAPPPLASASDQSYYSADHPYEPYPVSAPSNRLNFAPYYPPSTAPADSHAVRRPRSVTPSLPNRAPHTRRPSTANEVPTTFGSSHFHSSSWRHHSGSYAPRGYHPYAAPAHDHSYGTESSHSSPSSSPFAVSLNTPSSEYPSESPHATEYGSESSPQMHSQHHEYATPQEPSPHLQAQFAHVVSLENVSPIENPGLSYTETYDECGTGSNQAAFTGSSENVEATPVTYQYTPEAAGYTSRSGSSTDDAVYHLDPMAPAHPQMHQHYYEQQVA